MMPEHSPEPWRLSGDVKNGVAIQSADDHVVAIVRGPIVRPVDGRTREDARRIVDAANVMADIPTGSIGLIDSLIREAAILVYRCGSNHPAIAECPWCRPTRSLLMKLKAKDRWPQPTAESSLGTGGPGSDDIGA
jgi:hypothetical protein